MHNSQCIMHNFKKPKTLLQNKAVSLVFIIRSNDYSTHSKSLCYNLFQIIINYFITLIFYCVKMVLKHLQRRVTMKQIETKNLMCYII